MGRMSVLLRRATGAIGRPSVWLGMVLVLDAAIAVAGISVAHGSGLLGLLAAGPPPKWTPAFPMLGVRL